MRKDTFSPLPSSFLWQNTKASPQIVSPPPYLPPPHKRQFTFLWLCAPPSGWHSFCRHVSASLFLIFTFSPYFTLPLFCHINYRPICLSVLLVTLFVPLPHKSSFSLYFILPHNLSSHWRQCQVFPINNRQFFNIKSEASIQLLVRPCQMTQFP